MITIDYNAGEITFTPLFTITSEMRIAIEYQLLRQKLHAIYLCRCHTSKCKMEFWSYLYSENVSKTNPYSKT
jgi:hypothetical protein